MKKWTRALYQPCLPLGKGGTRITGSAEHISLSRKAAAEGIILLKNENHCLPLKKGSKVALFGKGSVDYVKGGGGSGDVTVAYIRNIYEGMKEKEAEGKVSLLHELSAFYEENVRAQYQDGVDPGMTVEPALPDELLHQAAAFTDTAILCISRFSGEGWDRSSTTEKDLKPKDYAGWDSEDAFAARSAQIFSRGDFYLTDAEAALAEQVTAAFANVIVVLNVGGVVDTSWFYANPAISSVLLPWQGGMEGGLAIADALTGDCNPSGKLPDTFARSLADYPSSDTFHTSTAYVDYTEDIYVGYRYFETIPGASELVNYPFGYGLSYTDFSVTYLDTHADKSLIRVQIQVTNIGAYAGKEVVQLYVSAPQGLLGKPSKVLAAFRKTRLLLPGESQVLSLSFSLEDIASYDDLGKIAPSAYILEAGEYRLFAGTSIRDVQLLPYSCTVEDTRITRQLTAKLVPHALPARMRSDGTLEALSTCRKEPETSPLPPQDLFSLECVLPETRAIPRQSLFTEREAIKEHKMLLEVYEGNLSLSDFTAQLSVKQLIYILGGQPNTGVSNTFGFGNLCEFGIPNITTADGPAGLRINPECCVTTTAWPCATLLASTWDPELIQEIGAAAALELKENNLGLWLTPAVNIHRSPLCGRNFEYYSEDPLLAGICGAAMVNGIQSEHIGACAKHFACNNKETNRKNSDSRVSERALREIYLKPFEIIVKRSQPYAIMSSYNLINGVRASENKELLTDILRNEWNFAGMVTTDWWTLGEHYKEIAAGNDLKMGCGYPERVEQAYEAGAITREELETSVKRILGVILRID